MSNFKRLTLNALHIQVHIVHFYYPLVKSHKPMACIQLFTNKPCIQSQGTNDERPIGGAMPRAGPKVVREVRCPQRTMESLFVNSALYSVRCL